MDSIINQLTKRFPEWIVFSGIIIYILVTLFPSANFYYEKFFTVSKLVAKINESYTAFNAKKENLYLFNISILNIGKKDFYPKTWDVKVKYIGEEKIWNTILTQARYFEIPIKNIQDNLYAQKRLKTENIRYIQRYPILHQGELISGYIAIEVPEHHQDLNIDKIFIEVSDFAETKRNVNIDYNDLKPEELFYDDSIWEAIK